MGQLRWLWKMAPEFSYNNTDISSFISYGDHQHWRMPLHGNLGQCSLSLCPWMLRCDCLKLHSVEGSPQISCVACCNQMTLFVYKPPVFAFGMTLLADSIHISQPFFLLLRYGCYLFIHTLDSW